MAEFLDVVLNEKIRMYVRIIWWYMVWYHTRTGRLVVAFFFLK